jgi:uncharacterized repeat protein (TIGR03843 family)
MDRSTAEPLTSPPLASAAQRAAVTARLQQEPLTPMGLLRNASNGTLLVQVGEVGDPLYAVYKPRAGERPLWDFPRGTLSRREVAACLVSDLLGWDVVPPTVWRDGPMGVGSVQAFVAHDPREHYFVLVEDPAHHESLARMALFDLLVNNADRKGSHVLRAPEGQILGVDHGLTFHVEPKLRTVIWDLGGYRVKGAWRGDLRRLADALDTAGDPAAVAVGDLLGATESAMLTARAQTLAGWEALPEVDEDERPYPWPPL